MGGHVPRRARGRPKGPGCRHPGRDAASLGRPAQQAEREACVEERRARGAGGSRERKMNRNAQPIYSIHFQGPVNKDWGEGYEGLHK